MDICYLIYTVIKTYRAGKHISTIKKWLRKKDGSLFMIAKLEDLPTALNDTNFAKSIGNHNKIIKYDNDSIYASWCLDKRSPITYKAVYQLKKLSLSQVNILLQKL